MATSQKRLWHDMTRKTQRSRTSNQSNLTLRVFISAAHHGPNCVIDHSNYVQVKLLQVKKTHTVMVLLHISL